MTESLTQLLQFSQPRRTAHEFVRETLRRAILSGALQGGFRLVQADIAAQLQVSTTPVREALRDLTADGLIVFDPHIGAVVRALDIDELIDLYDIRKVLEPLAIRKATPLITDAELAQAEELQRKMDVEEDFAAWAELNWQFHALLEQAANSPTLQSMVKKVQDTAAIYVARSLKFNPTRTAHGNAEHRELLDAMRARDGERAAEVLVRHLDGTLALIKQTRAQPEPQD
jgi:DNA-binding GntR family transcriptional regulator